MSTLVTLKAELLDISELELAALELVSVDLVVSLLAVLPADISFGLALALLAGAPSSLT